MFNLGEDPSGILAFTFSLNPVVLKERDKQLKKAMEEGDKKKVQLLELQASEDIVSIEVDTVAKDLSTEQGNNNFFDMLLESYNLEDDVSMI